MRHRASVLFELIQDDEQLKAERKKAKLEGREKYRGYSKDEIRSGGQIILIDKNPLWIYRQLIIKM